MTATLYAYFPQCPRKMWLHHHQIVMEQTSDLVAQGRILHEKAYPQRANRYRELQLPGIKIDQYDPKNGIVYEMKKSPKRAKAHEAQLKFYLWRLEQEGLKAEYGILEYPQQRRTQQVSLTPEDREHIPQTLANIQQLLTAPCPERLLQQKCKHCSYIDFCWSGEQKG